MVTHYFIHYYKHDSNIDLNEVMVILSFFHIQPFIYTCTFFNTVWFDI